MPSVQEDLRLKIYEDNFNPHEYRQFRLNLLKDEAWLENQHYMFRWLYEFFTSEEVDGDRLLDLASGPLIHNVATAASYFSNIILSDFLGKNRLELQKWLIKDPDCMDWSEFLKLVGEAEKLENLDKACEEIEDRIRLAVKGVAPCDILNEEVLPKEYSKQPFDVIISTFAIENIVANYEAYRRCIRRIKRLLKKDGKLLLMGLTEADGYEVNGHKFPNIRVVESEIQKALEMNGFGDIKWKTRNQPANAQPKICDKLYCVTATLTDTTRFL